MDKSLRHPAPEPKPGAQSDTTPEKGAETAVQSPDQAGGAAAGHDVQSGRDAGSVNHRIEWRRLDASKFLREYPDRDTAAFQTRFADWLVDWWPDFSLVFRFGHPDVLESHLDRLKALPVWDQVAELNRLITAVGIRPVPEEQVGFDFNYDNPPPVKAISDELCSEELCEDIIARFVTKPSKPTGSVPAADTEDHSQDGKFPPSEVWRMRLFVRHLTARKSYPRNFLLGLPDSRARRSVLKLLVELKDLQGLLQTCWRTDQPQPSHVHESEFLIELKALAAVNAQGIVEFVDQCCERLKSIYSDGSPWRRKMIAVANITPLLAVSPMETKQETVLGQIQKASGIKGESSETTRKLLNRAGILPSKRKTWKVKKT